MKQRFFVAGVVALLLGGAMVALSASDFGDAFCALNCPWSPLCIPPFCWPSGGGGGVVGS